MEVFLFFCGAVEALVKAVNPATDVYHCAFAGIKRMAFRANVDAQLLAGGASLKGLAASATHSGGFILWVDIVFHGVLLS